MMQNDNLDDRPSNISLPIDFAAAWRDHLLSRTSLRLDAAADRQFWETYAAHYDERTSPLGSYDQTLAVIAEQVRSTDTVVDVGAGTGRFALPLARLTRHVVAVDHALPMLAILREKAAAEGISNITVVESDLESMSVPPQDVVLAAWSLYRQLDLRAALEKLTATTLRTLIIVAPDAVDPPHRSLLKAIWGGDGEPDVPTYLYILGALRQIGVRADLRVVHERRTLSGGSPAEVAGLLAPLSATAADVARLAEGLGGLLQTDASGGFHYSYTHPVPIILWRRPAEDT
jgi:SAM-dependent methyltransferase